VITCSRYPTNTLLAAFTKFNTSQDLLRIGDKLLQFRLIVIKIVELAINMLHNMARNIPAAVPFTGNDYGRRTETDGKSFMFINPTYETKCSISKLLIWKFL